MTTTKKTTGTKMTLASKLSKIMEAVGYIQKDGKNAHHGYKYASAEAMFNKVRPHLIEAGVCPSFVDDVTVVEPGHVVVRTTLRLVDGTTGESFETTGVGEGKDKGDKAAMKAETAARKYAVSGLFLVSWGDDPEADAKTDETAYESLFRAIDKAADEAQLGRMKVDILALQGSPVYEELKQAYKNKLAELQK